jgi:hypothetical protein
MAERKFAALAELRRRPEPSAPPGDPPSDATQLGAGPPEPVIPAAAPPVAPAPLAPPAPPPVPVAVAAEPARGRGRPPGKRSDPDWTPRTILMRAKTHRRVSILLLERDDGPDLSELVDQLLTDWISKQP